MYVCSEKRKDGYAQNTNIITSKIIWTFVFYGTDFNVNRAHVHVGKRGTKEFCKIWLEPEVEVAKNGSLTEKQVNYVMNVTRKYKDELMKQWKLFKVGKEVNILKIKE